MTDSLRPDGALPSASLGRRREVPVTYTPSLLEAIPLAIARDCPGQETWVTLSALRFTCLCPVTSQPDWAELTINYVPVDRLLESKSLKEYLHSFRMHAGFHEDLCRLIADDVARCVAPRYLEVIGRFDSRGSIAIWPYVQYARPGDAGAEELRDLRHRHYAPGRWAPPEGMVR
jgi:7-cyano-7-deazaguanine reductase